VLPCAP